jgi:hypothetical protein
LNFSGASSCLISPNQPQFFGVAGIEKILQQAAGGSMSATVGMVLNFSSRSMAFVRLNRR